MLKLFLIISFLSTLSAELEFKFLINYSVCQSCTDALLADISSNLYNEFPLIKQKALVITSDIREISNKKKKLKHINFQIDTSNHIKNNYKIYNLPSLVLVDESDKILKKFEGILQNQLDYNLLSNFIILQRSIKLKENENELLLAANLGHENTKNSEICIFDYNNFNVKIFNSSNGELKNTIKIPFSFINIFRHNFTDKEWDGFYKDEETTAIKFQNCFFDDNSNILITGFCVGDTKELIKSRIINNEEKKFKGYQGIPKNFILKIEDNKFIADSLKNSKYAQLSSKIIKENSILTNVLPYEEYLKKNDSIFIFKEINIDTKKENLLISYDSLFKNKIKYRDSLQYILMAHSTYETLDNKLVFLNSYNKTAFIKLDDKFINIKPKGILKKVFEKDQKYTSDSFLDSSKIDNFNKYFIHSVYLDEDFFFINYYYYNRGNFEEIAVQKYDYKGFFKSEHKIKMPISDDKLTNISKVRFQSHKILTKWKKNRWKIIDLSEFIN